MALLRNKGKWVVHFWGLESEPRCSSKLASREPLVGVWNRSFRLESFPKSTTSSPSVQLGLGARGPLTARSSTATDGCYSSELASREPSVGV